MDNCKLDQLEGKVLPIILPPPIYYSLFAADKLSMIMLNKNAKNWLYNNFIQLIFYSQNLEKIKYNTHYVSIWPVDTMKMDYSGANMFLREYHDKICNLTRDNLIEHLKNWLDKGFYIIGNVDVTKLHGTRYFGFPGYVHSAMIIGYNDKELYQVDFSPRGNIDILRITYEDYVEAVFSDDLQVILREKKHLDIKYSFSLFELKDSFRSECKLDTNVMKFWVKNFIECADCGITTDFFMRREKIATGIDIYKNVLKLMDIMVENENEIDYKMFHAIYEHKLIMKDRVTCLLENNYLNQNKELLDMAQKNWETTQIIRNHVQKFNFTHDKKIIEKISQNMKLLEANESEFMNAFYKEL